MSWNKTFILYYSKRTIEHYSELFSSCVVKYFISFKIIQRNKALKFKVKYVYQIGIISTNHNAFYLSQV